jgi:hypothetical protein
MHVGARAKRVLTRRAAAAPPVPIGAPAELPSGLGRLSFVWERGARLLVTDPEPVNPHTRACFWQQQLRQVRPAAAHAAGSPAAAAARDGAGAAWE